MRNPVRLLLITAAVSVIGVSAAAIGGCASKPSAPQTPTSATATPQVQQSDAQAKTTASPKGQSGSADSVSAGAASAGAASAGAANAGAASAGTASVGAANAGTAGVGTAGVGTAGVGTAGVGTPRLSSAGAGLTAAAGSAVPPAQGQTADERRAAIDKRLNDSLGSFDAKLRTEQQKIAKERDGRQTAVATISASEVGSASPNKEGADGSGAGNDGSAVGTGDEGDGGNVNRHRGSARSERPGDLKSDKTAGGLKPDPGNGRSAAGNGAVANEIPDGNDDDVVARRLRKAAEQETDPELKDKLWKEYVEYKKNAQGK